MKRKNMDKHAAKCLETIENQGPGEQFIGDPEPEYTKEVHEMCEWALLAFIERLGYEDLAKRYMKVTHFYKRR